ncbi:ATP-binding protein [Kitasatospora sp. NPDC057692]|uniref:ATP-binding protein n=1 Tax=Kitasatospora sp. NPDC057692 TaxID=3346215 RepID=UPI003686D58F
MTISPLDTAGFPVLGAWGVPPDEGAVVAARRSVVAAARSWGLPLSADALGEVELCTGELLANAAEHTRAPCTVTVRWADELLRIEITDASPSLPRGEPDPEAVDGRGLLLVEALAQGWGWERSGAGKVVWFTYPPDLPVPAPSGAAGARGCRGESFRGAAASYRRFRRAPGRTRRR